MKRRSGVQMTFRLGQENDTNLFCVNIHCPTIILSGVRFFSYGHGTKCAKRTEAGPKAQLRARL